MANINGTAGDDTIFGDDPGADLLQGLDGNDRLFGFGGNDQLNGNNDNDLLEGGDGNDTLDGGNGSDTLQGDADNDRLIGGTGDDVLTGGAGGDVFVIESGSSDVITDYDAGEGDSLDLTGAGVTLSSAVLSEVGGSTVIDIGSGETLTLQGVTLAEFNAEPTVSGLTNRGAAEDTTGALDFSAVAIADSDTPGNITVTITATDTGAVLGAVDGSGVGAGVSETAAGNNVVTLVGTAADITTYLGNASAITYTSSQDRETDDTISIQADDGISTPNAASTATIVMTPLNDLPTASNRSIIMDSNTARVLTAADFSFSDVDSADSLTSVRIDTLAVTSGTFQLSGLDVNASDVILVADINAGNLVYTPAADTDGDDLLTLTFSVNDGTVFAASTSALAIDVVIPEPPEPVNQAPTNFAISNDTVDEDTPGAVVGTLSASDSGSLTFKTTAVTDDRFEVVGNLLKLKDGVSINFETETSVQVILQVDDEDGATTTKAFTITVVDIEENSAPTSISLSGSTVAENDGGASIGTLSAVDAEGGDITFTVSDDRFEVIDGVLQLANGVTLDFEEDPGIELTITATDSGGLSLSSGFTITVTDVDENDASGGSDDADTLDGGQGNDTLTGGAGDDTVDGGEGDDFLRGDAGDDAVSGGEGNDTVFAGPGDDGDDTIQGNSGDDVLGGGAGADLIVGDANDEFPGNDTIFGGAGEDTLNSGAGDDLVFNGGGDDVVIAGSGDDTLWAGSGDDQLSGGEGNDVFVFGVSSGNDTISDFATSADILDFSYSVFRTFAEVQAAASETTRGDQAGLLIDLGDDQSVFLVGIGLDDLSTDNLEF